MDGKCPICGATGEPCANPDCAECPIGREFRELWANQPVLHDDPDEFDERIG